MRTCGARCSGTAWNAWSSCARSSRRSAWAFSRRQRALPIRAKYSRCVSACVACRVTIVLLEAPRRRTQLEAFITSRRGHYCADVRGAHRYPTQCTLWALLTTRPQSSRRLRSTCTSLCLKLYTFIIITLQTNTWGFWESHSFRSFSLCAQDCSEQMSRNFNENLSHEQSTISKEVIRAYEDLMKPSKGLNF